MLRSILVSVCFSSVGMGFSFRVKALRFLFKAFSIRFVYACSLHVHFMFTCPRTPPHPTHPISDHYRPLFQGKICFRTFFDPVRKTEFINPISISLKWHILTVSRLFEERISALKLHINNTFQHFKQNNISNFIF